jgi:hypothetical protein
MAEEQFLAVWRFEVRNQLEELPEELISDRDVFA